MHEMGHRGHTIYPECLSLKTECDKRPAPPRVDAKGGCELASSEYLNKYWVGTRAAASAGQSTAAYHQ